jgi:hypothetical protein
MCISTDGIVAHPRTSSIGERMKKMYQLFKSYDAKTHLSQMSTLNDFYLTEHQFATLIGRSRMYQ